MNTNVTHKHVSLHVNVSYMWINKRTVSELPVSITAVEEGARIVACDAGTDGLFFLIMFHSWSRQWEENVWIKKSQLNNNKLTVPLGRFSAMICRAELAKWEGTR